MTATYIALEGPDGVGKSTVAAALKERLQRRTQPDHAPRFAVRIRHFPTDALTACADDGGYRLTAEDYAMDMENWLSFRPEPVLSGHAGAFRRPERSSARDAVHSGQVGAQHRGVRLSAK